MTNSSEQQNNLDLLGSYLKSPKEFFLEMPLYSPIDLSFELTAKKIHEFFCFYGTIDVHCIWCKKDSIFNTENNNGYAFDLWKKSTNSFSKTIYACTRNSEHKYHIFHFKEKERITKIGQNPSVADFQIPQAEKYRKILGEKQYKELTKAIGLKAHGIGIGSFVYLRRIFEDLVNEALKQAQEENKKFPIRKYNGSKMEERIKLLKDYLPGFLVTNRKLYSILSLGIHELSEQQCLDYFETIKISIEQILDEKIVQQDKAEKIDKAQKAIQRIHSELAPIT